MKCTRENLKLYGVTDRFWVGEQTLKEQVEDAILGGVSFIQLREKQLTGEDLLKEALDIQAVCGKYNVPFVINDDVALAKKIKADGVHVGQGDMNAKEARAILGENAIIGVTAKTVEQAVKAQKDGADYLGIGAAFSTTSKADALPMTRETMKDICRAVSIPVIGIGGINKDNVMQLSNTGICGVAVISGIFAQNDRKKAAEELKKRVETMLGPKTYPKTTGVIFDVDGVLLDSMKIWEHAGENYLKSKGIVPEENLSKVLFTMSIEEGISYIKEKYQLTESVSTLAKRVVEQVENFYVQEVQAKPGVEEVLKDLKKRGIPMVIATSGNKNTTKAALARLGLLSYFQEIFTCTEVGKSKNYPDIYQEAARKIESQPEHTWVVEDALHGAKTAKSAGFLVLGVYDEASAEDREKMLKLCDVYVEDLLEILTNSAEK